MVPSSFAGRAPAARTSRARRKRAPTGILALAMLVAAAVAAPASAAPAYHFYAYTPTSGNWSASVSDDNGSGSHTYGITVRRAGATIASGSSSQPYPATSLPGTPQAGDVLTLTVDGSAVSSVTLDGTPTINGDACTGSTRFTGANTPGAAVRAGIVVKGKYRPSNTSTVTTSGGSYAAALVRSLVAGDVVFAESITSSGAADLDATVLKTVGACPPPASPVIPSAPVVTPVTTAKIIASLNKTLGTVGSQITALDPRTLATQGAVNVPATLPTGGTLTLSLTAPAPAAGKASTSTTTAKKKAKLVTVATGSASRATAGKVQVKLKVTKAGKKLLRRTKRVKLTLVATFKRTGGKAVTEKKGITLKRHKAKAKAK